MGCSIYTASVVAFRVGGSPWLGPWTNLIIMFCEKFHKIIQYSDAKCEENFFLSILPCVLSLLNFTSMLKFHRISYTECAENQASRLLAEKRQRRIHVVHAWSSRRSMGKKKNKKFWVEQIQSCEDENNGVWYRQDIGSLTSWGLVKEFMLRYCLFLTAEQSKMKIAHLTILF